MTQHFRISETDCLSISGTEHQLIKNDQSGSLWSRLDDPAIHLSFTGKEFIELLSRHDVRLKRGFFSKTAAARRLRCDINYVQTLPLEKREKILWQTTCATTFLEAEARGETNRTERAVAAILQTLEARVNAIEDGGQATKRTPRAGQTFKRRHFPCARWLLQWVRLYETNGRTPLVFLRKQRTDLHTKRLAAEKERQLAICINSYLQRGGPTPEGVVRIVRDRFADINEDRRANGMPLLEPPSDSTVRRRIEVLDEFEVTAQREGIDEARRKFGFYEDGLRADYPLQRVEIDEWLIDICSLLGDSGALDGLSHEERAKFAVGRRWICLVLDCATRCVLGFRIVATPNADEAIRTLNLVVQDKTAIAEAAGCLSPWDQHGGFGILTSDQGPAFASEAFRSAVADLLATYEAPPAGVPKLRARIERIFRTFAQQLAPMLIGRTFGNPVERGDYPSEKWAALTDDQLAQIFTLFIVDIYHNTPHAGLKGETPANAWKRLAAEQGVTPRPDANHRRSVFGIQLERKLDRHGVRVFGINYTCPELQEAMLRGARRTLAIRVDPEDITHISVCIGHEWFCAEAVPRSVWGLHLDDWFEIIRSLRVRFRGEALLSEPIIREARKKISMIDATARRLKPVQPPHHTAERIDREEGLLCLGLRIGPDRSAATGDLERPRDRQPPGPDDLLGDVIGPATPLPQPPTDSPFGDSEDNDDTAGTDDHDDSDEWTFDD